MKNFFDFKSFLNFLRRNKLFTAINIVGFAISIMFIILLGLYIRREFAVDSFHPLKDRTFRLVHQSGTSVAAFAGPDLESRYPEIEKTVRLYGTRIEVGNFEGEMFNEDILLADSSFFSVFAFPFVEGNPQGVMPTPQDVVLTESFARKLFGAEPALGKTIKLEDGTLYNVNGVVRDFGNSHLKNPAVVMPLKNLDALAPGTLTYPGYGIFTLYIVTKPGADLAGKMVEMGEYFKSDQRYMQFHLGFSSDPQLEPMEKIYFSDRYAQNFMRSNDRTFISVLAVTALLILIFAVINYINLSVAQTGFRAKEAAIRRLLGGTRWQLFRGFIVESEILCFVSLLVGLALAALVQPWFIQVMGTDPLLGEGLTWANAGLVFGGVLLLGVFAGCIPAFTITSFQPIEVVRGTFRRRTKMVYSKVLIAFQYCITIVLVGCTITILRQVDYMSQTDMGFEKDYIIRCTNAVSLEQQAGFRDQLMAIPGVMQVAFASSSPDGGGNYKSFTDDEGNNRTIVEFKGDSSYMDMMGFRVLSRTGVPDADAVWMNETAWKKLGLPENATEYRSKTWNFRIRGRIEDFHFEDFSKPITEAIITPLPPDVRGAVVLVKVSGGDPFGTMERIGKVYNEQAGGNLFDGKFLEQRIALRYENQTRLSSILGSLSLLAIIISALGMLAMSTYFIRQKSQEVAVRKVFGATNREMLGLLMLNFLRLVLIAFVIAAPVIWYLMRDWLAGYAYRIPLSWTIFFLAGVTVSLVAVLTVLWQLLKAIHADPVVSLKNQ